MYDAMQKLFAAFFAMVGAVAMLVGIALLIAVPIMLLWDWLMPSIFGLRRISALEAWGLGTLSSLLVRSGGTGETGESK